MKTYTFKASAYERAIQVGEQIEINGQKVAVTTILEVDFDSETVEFCGINFDEMIE